MPGIKIAHISDMHLGSSFSSLPIEKAQLRKNEYDYICLNTLRDSADCDIIVLSGDIFDTGDACFSVADKFLSTVEELKHTKVFYSCGNHDSYYTDIVKYCVNNSPENLHIFPPDEISCFTIESLKTKVYGVSFSHEHQCDSLFETMPVCDDNYINILTMHADTISGRYNPIDLSEISNHNLDYIALGHIHNSDGINKAGKCFYAYSGVAEGRGFDECGDKGYFKGFITKESCDMTFCVHSKRRYIDEVIDITDFKNEYDLIDVINSMCLSQENICRFTLIGVNNFTGQIDTHFIASQCGCFYCVCIDNTKINSSVEGYLGYPGLIGACADEAHKMLVITDNHEEKEKIKKSFELLINIFENR